MIETTKNTTAATADVTLFIVGVFFVGIHLSYAPGHVFDLLIFGYSINQLFTY